jgi:hypothetical protein
MASERNLVGMTELQRKLRLAKFLDETGTSQRSSFTTTAEVVSFLKYARRIRELRGTQE